MHGRKMAQIWQDAADDMGKGICYTGIVYKWVREDPLVFFIPTSERSVIDMKYCPYCGAGLPDGTVSFCPECGNVLPGEKKDGRQPGEIKRESARKKAASKKRDTWPPEPVQTAPTEESQAVTDDYDGYYDDILPMDEGRQREGIDPSIIKKIAALLGCLVVVIGLCIALMYLL